MVVTSVMTLFGLGLVAAGLLALASRVFHVEEDPKVEAVLEALPGANCGGCGYAGCEGYAQAVTRDPAIAASLCVAGGADTAVAVGALTGKTVSAAEPLLSYRRCDKVNGEVSQKYDYQGMPSCAAVAALSGGNEDCTWSCLGFGDCEQTCPFDAITIANGLAEVDPVRCTGCGACVAQCPRNVLQLIPKRSRVTITCATKDKLRAVMDICKAGCINCGKCIKACPARALSNDKGRLEIDHTLCLSFGPECGEACVHACSRRILRVHCPTLQEQIRTTRRNAAKANTSADAAKGDAPSGTAKGDAPADTAKADKATDTARGDAQKPSTTEQAA